jgi:hypothetical protein
LRILRWVFLPLILAALLAGAWLQGSVVVLDETAGVDQAWLTNRSGAEQRLSGPWGGRFFGIPSVEGTIELRCRDSAVRPDVYVGPHLHTWIKVVGPSPCQDVVVLR